jgi:biopolymer transport protein ExbD
MRTQSYSTLEEETKIDMTPMLDIVFIMLIFFIVTSSFLKEQGIPLTIPENSPPTVADKVSVIITISEDNEVWFGKRRIDIRAVGANLKRKISELDNPSVIIKTHPGSKSNILIQVADRVRDAGVFDFVVMPIKLP